MRFFHSPDARSPAPWHAIHDLYIAIGIPTDIGRQMLADLVASFPPDALATVNTPAGLTVIGPDEAADGILDAFHACQVAVLGYRAEHKVAESLAGAERGGSA